MPAIVEHRPDIVATAAVAVHPAPSVDAQRNILSTLEIVEAALQVAEDADLAASQFPELAGAFVGLKPTSCRPRRLALAVKGGTRQESTAIQTRPLMMVLLDTILKFYVYYIFQTYL